MDGDTFSIPDVPDEDVIVAKLAGLSPIAYDRVRVAEAARIGCRTETLDRQVEDARRDAKRREKEADADPEQAEDVPPRMGQAEAVVEIARAAAMDEITYDQHKRDIAARIGITVATLDKQVVAARRSAARDDDDCPAPRLSDEALALAFSTQHADRLRYVAAWGKWLRWDDARWAPDTTLTVFDLARTVCRIAAAQENNPAVAANVAAATTIAAVERLARADRRHAATVEQWDCDPWLLNTPDINANGQPGRNSAHTA